MKLVELLVQELPKRGGWPEHATKARQDEDGEVCFEPVSSADDFYTNIMSSDSAEWLEENNMFLSALYVTREEYEDLLTKGDKSTMKLIDILVKELPLRGGWPEGVEVITQDDCGSTCLWMLPEVSATHGFWRHPTGQALKEYWPASRTVSLAMDRNTAIVSKEDYEKALAKLNKTDFKLIDLLVQELPKRTGWPVGADYAVQDCDGSHDLKFGAGAPTVNLDERGVWCNFEKPVNWGVYTEESYIRDVTVQADDAETSIVYREDYEAAIAGEKELSEWDGVGLPPVGTEVEVMSSIFGWKKAKVTAVTATWLVAQYDDGVEFAGAHRTLNGDGTWRNAIGLFRRLKSEKEVKDESTLTDLSAVIRESGSEMPQFVAKQVIAAIAEGKVSGIKLTD